jgi:hypothetical protein
MPDYVSKLKNTRGLWIFFSGAALVLVSPLPLKLGTLTFGGQGNPLGLGLFYVAAALAGAIAVVIGCVTVTIELIVLNSYRFGTKTLACCALCVSAIVGGSIVGRNYLALMAAAGPGGPTQTKVLAKDLGIVRTPPGFSYSDLTQERGRTEFKLIDPSGLGSLSVTIATRGGWAANHASCSEYITADAVKTQTFSRPVGRTAQTYRHGAEQSLTFFAANRSYALSTQAVDPLDAMVGNYNWKEPGTHHVPIDVIISIARQLCAGAADPKAKLAIG